MSGQPTSRRTFLNQTGKTGAGLVALSALQSCTGAADRRDTDAARPNLIFLFTDDQRWDALGCMGNRLIQTPNLDRLAAQGVRFNRNFCTTSICMSSRATALTGLYTCCHGIDDFRLPLSADAFAWSFPAILRRTGYRTGFVGKWGLGGELPTSEFDFFEGFSGQGKYFNDVDGETVHMTSILENHAVDFLNGCTGEQPFCLSMSFKAPHVQDSDPRQFLPDPVYDYLYQNEDIPAPKTATEEHFDRLPDFIQSSEGRVRWEKRFKTPEMHQRSVKNYYRLIAGVDQTVGRIRDVLSNNGFQENTVIVFSSDNGFFLGEHGLAGKWLMQEESIRTPLIISDPRLPKRHWNRSRDEMTLNIDIAPTLLELAGIQPPSFMQGRSLAPLLRGRVRGWRGEWYYEHLFEHPRIPKNVGIRTDRWKYIRYVQREPVYEELFDLETDPCEEHNLVLEAPSHWMLADLRERLSAWEVRLAAWRADPAYDWKDPI